MKNSKLFTVIFVAGLTLASSAFASGNYRLVCDDNNIFEVPMHITIHGSQASAAGEFSGPGDALFSVNYQSLDAVDLRTTDQGEIEQVTITQPVVVGHPFGFQLSLKAQSGNQLKGHISMISTDSDRMPYEGEVTCTAKEL